MKIELTVNGSLYCTDVPPMKTLLGILRDELGLKGSKEGCGEGECGACSVIMNGRLVNACLVPAVQASGSEILTIEGLGTSDDMDMLQKAFVTEGAVQCGFCTPGMILASRALLEENPSPSKEEIKIALSGNICRCTGYEKIYAAINKAVADGYCSTFKARSNLCSASTPVRTDGKESVCFAPASLSDVLKILDENHGISLIAGTTDVIPDLKNGKFQYEKILDISRVPELKGIKISNGTIVIGSCTTNGEIIRSGIIKKYLPALWDAAFRSGAPAVQNRATIGGNIATASGAADLPSILLPLDAGITVQSAAGTREMKLESFIRGYRDPDLRENEVLREITIPIPREGSVQRFYKRGSRKALTLSRISLGFYAEVRNGVVHQFRAAAGSMSPIPVRLVRLENLLEGQTMTYELIRKAAETASEEVNPRKSSAWRKTMAANLVGRFLGELIEN
jgi:carbon-monoxide dehydrogenase small subunit/xanthine dehydrogenase small subunit